MKTLLVQTMRPRTLCRLQSRHHSSIAPTCYRHKYRRRSNPTTAIVLSHTLHSRPEHHSFSSDIHRVSFATATASSRVVLPASLSGPYPAGSPLAKYVTELRDGRLRPDIRQEKAMKKLQQLWEQVEQYLPAAPVHQATAASPTASSDNDSGSSGGFFSFARRLGGIFASRSSSNASSSSSSSAPSFSPSSSAPVVCTCTVA